MKKLQDKVEHQKPSDVYAQMTDPCHNNSMDIPRDIRQCQNVKALQKAEKRGRSNNNIGDELLNVFQMVSEQHPFVAEVIYSRENPLPSVICYTDDQVKDFKSFVCSNEGVVGVDRTFSLGKCFVTTTVYKSNKSSTRHPDCERKLCSKHIKDNVIRQVTDKIPKSTTDRNDIVNLIFGRKGVASANDSVEFDEKNTEFKSTLHVKKHDDFAKYYEKYVEKKILDHVVSTDDQLWTNNNTESINNRRKVQLVDLRRALYGSGNFILNTRYAKRKTSKLCWTSKSEDDKRKMLRKLLTASSTKNENSVQSTDCKYTVFKNPNLAKKPIQRTRCRATRSQQ
ncbi:hypothetical protein MAR_002841, partial [Mya arenaria]